MTSQSQARALVNYRKRLRHRGMARFEVLAPARDRELIRALARKLATDGVEADEMRNAIQSKVLPMPSKKGGILAALRRSPLVGAELDLRRPRTKLRKVEL